MNSLISLLWVIGNVVGVEVDSAMKYGTLAWILFLFNFWKSIRTKEQYYLLKGSKAIYENDSSSSLFIYIKKNLLKHKFEIVYALGTILTQIDSGGWRFYDSALLYLIGFGRPKTEFHPLFFAIICMSFGISVYFILLEPILFVLSHIFITGIQSLSFKFFSKKESIFQLATMLFFACSFFKHGITLIPEQDKYYESDSIVEELLTLNVPILTLLPAAFELFFLIKCCKILTMQELFLSFVLAEVLKFIEIQRFSLLLSIIWLLLIAIYSKQSSADFDLEDENNQALSKRSLGMMFIVLVTGSIVFSYQILPNEDRQQKFRYHFVKEVEDHFNFGNQWSIKVDHPKNLFIGNMNHFVHMANRNAIYFENSDSYLCNSSVIILPPGIPKCDCSNLRTCASTHTSFNGYYPVLRSDSERWNLFDPCEIPLMFDGVSSNVFQNRSLIRNEKVVKTTNIITNLVGCFNSVDYLIYEYHKKENSFLECKNQCASIPGCVSFTLNYDTCFFYNTIPQTKKCKSGESSVLIEKYRCERIRT